MDMKEIFGFYKGRKVLVTGHTGFKRAWLCKMLLMAGADVTGYALCPPTEPNLFGLCSVARHMNFIKGEICDLHRLEQVSVQHNRKL